jgi:hypothetical protein
MPTASSLTARLLNRLCPRATFEDHLTSSISAGYQQFLYDKLTGRSLHSRAEGPTEAQ